MDTSSGCISIHRRFSTPAKGLQIVTVYVVGHSPRTGPVKIGFTDNIDERLRCLRRGEACSLAVHQRFSSSRPTTDLALLHSIDDGDRQLERHLHFVFRQFRIDGEWFSLGSTPDEVITKVTNATSSFYPQMEFAPAAAPTPFARPSTLEDPAPEPLTLLGEAAVRHHEMFRAWMDAGFTEDQALRLLIAATASEFSIR